MTINLQTQYAMYLSTLKSVRVHAMRVDRRGGGAGGGGGGGGGGGTVRTENAIL